MDNSLRARLIDALLGKPLVGNAFRGTLAEAILAGVLEPEWRWRTDGWGCFDFERADGTGLEVKQSAAVQDWHCANDKPSPGRFDIRARTGRYEPDGTWVAKPGRAAALYVFARHPVVDHSRADHRDAAQWEFYAVRATDLPAQKTIALSGIRVRARAYGIDEIADAVRGLAAGIAANPSTACTGRRSG